MPRDQGPAALLGQRPSFTCEVSGLISPSLPASELACQSSLGAARRQETPGSEPRAQREHGH